MPRETQRPGTGCWALSASSACRNFAPRERAALRARHGTGTRRWRPAGSLGFRRAEWITDLDTDHENLRAAIEFCVSDLREVPRGGAGMSPLAILGNPRASDRGAPNHGGTTGKARRDGEVRPQALWVAGFWRSSRATPRGREHCWKPRCRRAQAAMTRAWRTHRAFSGTPCTGSVKRIKARAGGERPGLHQRSGDQVGVVLAQMQIGFIHLCAGRHRRRLLVRANVRARARAAAITGTTLTPVGLGVAALLDGRSRRRGRTGAGGAGQHAQTG